MGSFLDGLGTLWGGQGNAGNASSNAWNYGQYSPYTVNNPAGQVSFNGTTANSQLSPLQQQLQGAFGGAINGGLSQQYNPNTSFLPQQYQNIFGNFQGNVNSQFQALQQAQAPWIQQGNQSDRDNQYSKGTLASTAGQYQTAGHDMANNALTQQNYATAFGNANSLAANQFGAAQGTAGLGEQQAQFGPQLGLQRAQAGMSGLNSQNTNFLQMLQAGGNLGAQRSGANVAAATPGIETGNTQDQATSGLLSGLLFGGGTTGGLLQSLLGNGGSGSSGLLGGLGSLGSGIGGLLGKVGGLFGGGGGGDASSYFGSDYGTGGGGADPSSQGTFNGDNSGDPSNWMRPMPVGGGGGEESWFTGGGFNGAGGQAATPNLQNIGVDNVSTLPSVQNAINRGAANGGGLSSLGQGAGLLTGLGGIASGIQKGGVAGGIQAAGNVGKLYNQLTGQKGGYGGLLGQAGSALNIYNGLTSGTPQGVTSGLASGAGLAASSGAASAMGASASTVAALGAAATGIGAIAAIPGVVQGLGGLVMGKILGADRPDKMGNELSILRTKGGVSTVAGTAGQSTFGLGSQQKDYYNGKLLDKNKFMDPTNVQKASDLYLSGNMAGYDAFMKTLLGG